ncbi:MAG TPA: nitrophenyl compound nitroreductase subunit ArsF family protein [bacterium]|nr:nitrophenyl compound nitroreductase subunit ArsF family protein [bacterium]
MSARAAVRAVLLVFVAASVGYLVAQEMRPEPAGAEPGERAAADGAPPAARVVAYYFHATMRCPTCLAIEKGAREALERDLSAELADGELVWRSLNMEETANERLVSLFGLTTSSLVLVRETAGGEVAEWRNLEDVWELVGDDPRFGTYVLRNARELLGTT